MFLLGSFQRKLIPLILLAGLSTQTFAITFQEIGDMYTSSYGTNKQQPQNSTNKPDDIKKETLNISVRQLSDQEQRHIVFSLLSQLDQSQSSGTSENSIAQVLQDLAVLHGQPGSENISLTSITNYCTTMFGEAALASMLAQNVQAEGIQKRQALIKGLVADTELFNQVQELLYALRQQTNALLSLWAEENKLTQDAFKRQYFSKIPLKYFNNNSIILEGSVRLGNVLTAIGSSLIPLEFIAMNYLPQYIAYKRGMIDKRPSILQAFKVYFKSINPRTYIDLAKDQTAILEANRAAQIEQFEAIGLSKENAIERVNNDIEFAKKLLPKIAYGTLGVVALIHGYQAYLTKKALSEAIRTKNTINYLQTRLIGAATLINAAKSVTLLATKHQELTQGLTLFNEFSKLFAPHQNKEFDKLVNLLQKSTFKGTASFFSLSGRVLATNKLMENHKQELINTMLALGELDACLSIAKMIKEFQHKRVGYCFVEFIDHETPYLKLEEFWNPFVNPSMVVTNSIELGGTEPRAIVVTGSNTGGKSTNLKAIMTSILLARTFGIAPAGSATMTKFAYLGTSMNVSDNTAIGDSTFQAQVKRAESLVKKVESLQKEFGCLIIDELFTGTGPEKGAPAAKLVAAYLASSKNIILIFSTHFPEITRLEQETDLFKNYKVDVYKDESGNLVRPFRLEPGVSTSNVADDILNQRLSFLTAPAA